MSGSLVKIYCKKLGLTSSNLLKVAEEMVRLVELKGAASSLPSSSLVVMAIDMAASKCSILVEKTDLMKLSGLPSKKYQMHFRRLEQVIQPQSSSSSSSLSVMSVSCGLTEAEQLAAKVIKEYQSTMDDSTAINPALLHSAALYCAAKATNLKVDKQKMITQAGVNAKLFQRLVTILQPISTQLAPKGVTKVIKKRKEKTTVPQLEESHIDEGSEERGKRGGDEEEEEEEDYYVWKARILESAKKALEESQR